MIPNKNNPVPVIPIRYLTAGVVASVLLAACGSDNGDLGETPPAVRVAQINNLTGSVKDVTTELHEGTNMAAAPSPDGESLLYQTPERVLNVRGNLVSGSEDLFPFPVHWLPDGRFVYTSDGKIGIRDAARASAGEVAFSANLTVRRPVFNKFKDREFDRMGP